jgi:hypothetical protein
VGSPANDDEPHRLTIRQAELEAYARGELAEDDRRRIEGYLACNPDLAAQMMAERHRAGARSRPRRRTTWRLIAAGLACCVVSAAAGSWLSAEFKARWREADGDAAPAYVEDALESHQATLVRAAMVSQAAETRLDADEIRKTMRIGLPPIPQAWKVLDVQVFPSDDGPGVSLWLEAPGGRRFTLFAVSADTVAGPRPQLASDGIRSAAFWESARSAFVLLGDGAPGELMGVAQTLAANAKL